VKKYIKDKLQILPKFYQPFAGWFHYHKAAPKLANILWISKLQIPFERACITVYDVLRVIFVLSYH